MLEPLNKSSLYINAEPLVIRSPVSSVTVDTRAQGFRDEYSLADLDTLTDLLQVIRNHKPINNFSNCQFGFCHDGLLCSVILTEGMVPRDKRCYRI